VRSGGNGVNNSVKLVAPLGEISRTSAAIAHFTEDHGDCADTVIIILIIIINCRA
jgi:hypothetical protein